MSLLSVENLSVRFSTPDGDVHAVNDVSFEINTGQRLALVGESGSGKSQIAMAILGLQAPNAHVTGRILYQGVDLLRLPLKQLNRLRAKDIAMVFQDPMSSLNPYMTIERQLNEALELHEGLRGRAARARVLEAMDAVQIPDAKNRLRAYPHEFSGGMRQRIVIAMALICRPKLILADEPTTALDVTVQAQILRLLEDIQLQTNTSILLITHDLGVVAGFCEETLVLYGGRLMERGATRALFAAPSHPYTRGLMQAVPNILTPEAKLRAIPGQPPNQRRVLQSCPFAPRCADAIAICSQSLPPLTAGVRPDLPQRACLRPVSELSQPDEAILEGGLL